MVAKYYKLLACVLKYILDSLRDAMCAVAQQNKSMIKGDQLNLWLLIISQGMHWFELYNNGKW